MYGFFIDFVIPPGQFFQGLIWIRVFLRSQYRLNRFGYHRPVIVQVFVDLRVIHNELAQSFLNRTEGDQGMRKGYADIP